MEALQQMSLDVLFCMGRVASCSTYLTSSQKSNLEMVMSESWQLVDLFIEWDWETYFTEHGQENAKYNMGKISFIFHSTDFFSESGHGAENYGKVTTGKESKEHVIVVEFEQTQKDKDA